MQALQIALASRGIEAHSPIELLRSQSRDPSNPVVKDDLQKLPLSEVEKCLGSPPEGLTEIEANSRLAQYGPNEIPEKRTSALLKFLGYFLGPIPWMIEVGVVLSAVVRH